MKAKNGNKLSQKELNVSVPAQNREEEFESIYNRSADMVYNVALRITGNPYFAEETVQEVFLKVFKNLARFEYRSNITTWIYRITVHTAINIAKSRSRTKRIFEVIDEQIESILSNPNDNVEKRAEQKSRDEFVRKMLDSLEPRYRSYIVLREIEGLSYEEISKIMKKNINTVRTRIKRAREQLIKLFGREVERNEM